MQNVYKVQNKAFKTKLQILSTIEFEPSERPIYVTGTRNYSGYLIAAFENGKIGKITMESYKTEFNRKKLKSAFNNESPLVFIEHVQEDIDLVAISSINKVILFNTRQINPVGSKTTKGFHVLKSKDGSIMINVKKYEQVKFQDPAYYRRDEGLNVVGFYLKQGDEI
jgi:DNA gyrase/topoisomerase IV subunit A